MFCPNCGNPVGDIVQICDRCDRLARSSGRKRPFTLMSSGNSSTLSRSLRKANNKRQLKQEARIGMAWPIGLCILYVGIWFGIYCFAPLITTFHVTIVTVFSWAIAMSILSFGTILISLAKRADMEVGYISAAMGCTAIAYRYKDEPMLSSWWLLILIGCSFFSCLALVTSAFRINRPFIGLTGIGGLILATLVHFLSISLAQIAPWVILEQTIFG